MYLPEKKAPYKQQKWSLYKRWQVFAPLGLALCGFGLCLISETSHIMHDGAPTIRWVVQGTISLVIFCSGLAFFGEAVKCRALYEMRRALKKHQKKRLKDFKAKGKLTKSGTKPEPNT